MAKSPYDGKMRLTVDIPTEVFITMKLMAVERNCSITKWITRAIVKKINHDKRKER
jgi:hypothetical protein